MATPLRQSALARRLADAGGIRTEEDGWVLYSAFVGRRREVAAARQGMVLADESGNGCVEVAGVEAADILATAFGLQPLAVGQGFTAGGRRLMRVAPMTYLVATLRGGEASVIDAVAGVGGAGAARDLTPGVVQIRLIGPAAPATLGGVCDRDLHPRVLADGGVLAAGVLGCACVVSRRDIGPLPSYVLVAPRSLGLGLWDGLLRLGQPAGAMPIGIEALKELKIVSKLYEEKRLEMALGRKAGTA